MPDMRDVITKGIQSYADSIDPFPESQLAIRALAPALADHLVDALPLIQQWAVGTEINGKLDDLDDEDEDREAVIRHLAEAREFDRQTEASYGKQNVARNLYTSFGIDWIPDPEPDIEEDLLRLVEQDADDGTPEPEHDWQPTGF